MTGVYMQETAVTAVATILRANLATQLGTIDAAKADGITTDKPASADIVEYARMVTALESNILIEVFSDRASPILWLAAETDRSRVTAENQVTVRVSVVARDTETPDHLFKKVSRTVSGIISLLAVTYYDLSAAVEYCQWMGTTMRNLAGDQIVRQADVVFNVRTRETSS